MYQNCKIWKDLRESNHRFTHKRKIITASKQCQAGSKIILPDGQYHHSPLNCYSFLLHAKGKILMDSHKPLGFHGTQNYQNTECWRLSIIISIKQLKLHFGRNYKKNSTYTFKVGNGRKEKVECKDFSDNYKKPRGEATHDAHMQPSGAPARQNVWNGTRYQFLVKQRCYFYFYFHNHITWDKASVMITSNWFDH